MADKIHGLIRRILFYYVFLVICEVQVLFVLTGYLGMDFDPPLTAWLITAVIPVALMSLFVFLERRGIERHALKPWWLWAVMGSLLFGFWSGGYFLVGLLTDPGGVHLIEPAFDRFVPFRPHFVFLYLDVYPLCLLPFLYARRQGIVHRAAVGYVAMLLISYTVFLCWPVAFFDRPVLAQPAPDFARWTLQLVYGQDPPWNCLPSTHCAMAMLAALAIVETDWRLGSWAVATALGIGVSTLYTKQHYIVDVIAGYALAGITYWMVRWIWRNPERLPERARRLIERDGDLDGGDGERFFGGSHRKP